MKKQHFLALTALLALLLAARFVLRFVDAGTATALSEAGVHRVLKADVDPDAVTWLQVTPPAPPALNEGEAPAPRRYEKRNGAWVVASMGGAPADPKAVAEFVAKAARLAGETRGSGESSWPVFGVDAAAAVKVELGAESGTLGTLLVGKQGDDGDAHFVRAEGSDEVLHAQDGLRSALGLWGEGAELAADLWLRKDVLALTGADVTRLVVERADGRVVLEKSAASPEPAPAWTVAEPALPFPARSGLDAIVDRAAQVRVAGTLDAESPACKSEPALTATFTMAAGGERVARVRGVVEGKEDVAFTIDGQPHCWAMSSWSLGTLAPRTSALSETPQAFADAPSGDPSRVRWQRGGSSATATKSGDEWKVSGAGLDGAKAASIASAVRYLRLDDLVSAASVPDALRKTDATVTVEIGGVSLTVEVLGERPGGLGERYARLRGPSKLPDGWLLVLGKSSVQSLLG